MASNQFSTHLGLGLMTVFSVCLASCQDSAEEPSPAAAINTDPPGAAKVLSLGGQIPSDLSEEDADVNCAAALRITASTLSTMGNGAKAQGVRELQAAAKHFAREAEQAQGGSAERVIRSKVAENAEDRSGQARLAIACIRRLDEPSTGPSAEAE